MKCSENVVSHEMSFFKIWQVEQFEASSSSDSAADVYHMVHSRDEEKESRYKENSAWNPCIWIQLYDNTCENKSNSSDEEKEWSKNNSSVFLH